MTEQQQVNQSKILIGNHFSIDAEELVLAEDTFGLLEKRLTSIVSYLLDKDMNRLLNSLYRIDVDEFLFRKILTEEAPEDLSKRIAQEIIKRELQKVELRAKYSES